MKISFLKDFLLEKQKGKICLFDGVICYFVIDKSNFKRKTMDAVVIFLLVIYIPLVIISIVGNILIVLSVNVFKNMRKPFNVFHGNLAFADLLFAIATIFDAIQFVSGIMVYTEFSCVLSGIIIESSYTVSVLTLTVMSKDRYDVVTKPFKNTRTIKQNIVKVVFVWLIALATCSATLYSYRVGIEDGKEKCLNRFTSKQNLINYSVQSVICYFIPMIIMVFCHVKLSKILIEKHKNMISENLTDNIKLKQHQKTKKVVELVLILTITFFIFWSPFIYIRIINHSGVYIDPTLDKFSHFWVFCSTTNNFIIYTIKRKDFRNSFKTLLLCKCFSRKESTRPSVILSFDKQVSSEVSTENETLETVSCREKNELQISLSQKKLCHAQESCFPGNTKVDFQNI